jgi:hypothetical protein
MLEERTDWPVFEGKLTMQKSSPDPFFVWSTFHVGKVIGQTTVISASFGCLLVPSSLLDLMPHFAIHFAAICRTFDLNLSVIRNRSSAS